ncbi:MAG: demethoxyubiquinone hydroxylase family protein [Desulfobacterales bacterium]|nr:MAG: demethoxyubiquinone hydroxylase family protein [Desulfobacterales bacterium]
MEKNEIINSLNRDLRAELSAVEIYSAHAQAIKEDEIAQGVKAILEVERGHAQELTKRIEELGGLPAKSGEAETRLGKALGVSSGEGSTLEMLKFELSEEQQAIKDYSAEIADIMYDTSTISMLKKHLMDEIDHADWLKSKIAVLEGKQK